MNLFVADPAWRGWIIWYFFLGGIAAGAYVTATLVDSIGREQDRGLARLGYWIAFPLAAICGLLLILDLGRPDRFWHMLFKSEVVSEAFRRGWPWSGDGWSWMARAPLLKYWSPMSIGSWALLIFGLTSFLSFLGSLSPPGRPAHWLRRGMVCRALQVIGSAVGLFVACYTGALLTATNQPLWSDTVWIAPLFLTSAASTGIGLMIVLVPLVRSIPIEAIERLGRADRCAITLEAVVFTVFLASLGTLVFPLFETWRGVLLVVGTCVFAIGLPLVFDTVFRRSNLRPSPAALSVLMGGFILRYTLLTTPPELLANASDIRVSAKAPERFQLLTQKLVGFGPEDGRVPGGGPGADPDNQPAQLNPRSKVFIDE